MQEKHPLRIYTDGSSRGNPGRGGYGVVLIWGQARKELSCGYRLTTNNRMELLAVIKALESLNKKNIAVPNNDVAIALLAKEDINTKTNNETITLTKEMLPLSISNVNEEAKNNIEAITPIQVQYSNIDTDEEDRVINIANLEIDGAKFREFSRKITTLFKRNKPENDKYK